MLKQISTNYLMPIYPTFAFNRYCTHDIEDGIDKIKDGESLGSGEFLLYNLFLLVAITTIIISNNTTVFVYILSEQMVIYKWMILIQQLNTFEYVKIIKF